MKPRIPKTGILSAPAQSVALQKRFPSGLTTWSRRAVRWIGNLCPSEFGRNYLVELRYEIGDKPDVWVREPNLAEFTNGRKLPHVYDQKAQRLCLYFPGVGFWRPNMPLARTILPWSCLWLHTFEIWLVTDVWHTKGVHPDGLKIG